jgi:hypothetical protein
VPADLAAALKRADGARAAFDALAPSHRRELLRYMDDARTPETRARRIAKAVDHVLGRERAPERRRPDRPLWTCPKCGNAFVNPNQYHSCRRHELGEAFAGKPAAVRRLFDRLREMIEACGPVRIVPYRDRVAFMVRVRFAGAVPRAGWLDVEFLLPRRLDDARIRRVETLYPNVHVHRIRVTGPEQLDAELATWLGEAYAVGRQDHLGSGRTPARPRS